MIEALGRRLQQAQAGGDVAIVERKNELADRKRGIALSGAQRRRVGSRKYLSPTTYSRRYRGHFDPSRDVAALRHGGYQLADMNGI
jgi:hypothetical protein